MKANRRPWADLTDTAPTARTVGTVALLCALVLLLPVAAQAVSNLVTIVGPGNSSQSSGVKVDNGELRVGDGAGSLTIDGRTLVALDEAGDAPGGTQFTFDTSRFSSIRIYGWGYWCDIAWYIDEPRASDDFIRSDILLTHWSFGESDDGRGESHDIPGRRVTVRMSPTAPAGCSYWVAAWGHTP